MTAGAGCAPGNGDGASAPETSLTTAPTILWPWMLLAGLLLAAALALVAAGPWFAYERSLIDIPSREVFAGLFACGLAYLGLLVLIPRAQGLAMGRQRTLLIGILLVGLVLRLLMLATVPALEDDYNRYLWDGAVTASGLNPYRYSPDEVGTLGTPDVLDALAEAASPVHERINHPDLRTIYPPVAQAAFAAAFWLAPFDLTAWRFVCILGEIATAAMILILLAAVGRSPLWVALYWWNPLVIKEMVNSAHMEAILMPLVVAAVVLAVRERPRASAVLLGLAMGAKIWPVLLAPILYRDLVERPAALVAVGAILAGLAALWATPILLAGLDETSGFVAFATFWQTNSALTPTLVGLAQAAGLESVTAGRLARGLLGLLLFAVIVRLAWPAVLARADIAARVAWATTALVLLSPAQFPWYLAWALPFMAVRPTLGLGLATALVPAYYASFHHLATDTYASYRDGWVYAVWLPIWAGLASDLWRARSGPGAELWPAAREASCKVSATPSVRSDAPSSS